MATIQCVRFDRLAPFNEVPRTSGDEQDVVLEAERGVPSGRVPIYINGESDTFDLPRPPKIRLTLRRANLSSPLHVAFGVVAQNRLDEDNDGSGVVLIAGWDPTTASDMENASDLLMVVAR